MTIGSENLGNGSAKPERFAAKYRGARRDGAVAEDPATRADLGTPEADDFSARGTDVSGLEPVDPPTHPPTLPSLDPAGLREPVFPPAGWPDTRTESMVDHPLLRGLLMELPPKGTVPGSVWLDRWFEAARAILELLYVQDASRSR